MTDTKSPGRCIVCNKLATQGCKDCGSAAYCSIECQRNDNPIHKLICEVHLNFDLSTRPSKNHVMALLFPEKSANIQLIWLDMRNSENGWPTLLNSSTWGDLHEMYIWRNNLLDRDVPRKLTIVHREAFSIDGSQSNQSIATIQETRIGRLFDWRGPVIAYGCGDLHMTDFRHVADFFRWYCFNPVPWVYPDIDIHYRDKSQYDPDENCDSDDEECKVQAVRINCGADIEILKRPPFEKVEIASKNSIFSQHDTSDIAERLEIPIFTRQIPPDLQWAHDRHASRANQDATFLHLNCDPEGDFDEETGEIGWGYASMPWQSRPGSVIVVRQDKKPLWPWHVEALCKYIREDLQPYFGHSLGEINEDEPMDKELVLKFICKPGFELRWNKLRNEKDEKGETCEAPHPYRI